MIRKTLLAVLGAGTALSWGIVSAAQVATPAPMAEEMAKFGHAARLLIVELGSPGIAPLDVSSPSYAAGGDIPRVATQYGANRFPGTVWGKGPSATRSWVVVVQGQMGGTLAQGTSIHLVAYNLPAQTHTLPEGMASLPQGASYGPNVHGPAEPYAGPHTHDASRHAYHTQVFALDTRLSDAAGRDFAALRAEMQGHVLAAGEIVAYAAKPTDAGEPVRTSASVHVAEGLLRGVAGRDQRITVYRGIPYAAPPVGPLRWRPPATAIAWTGVREAAQFGAACPQPGDDMAKGLPQSEDCLTANIWTGAAPASDEKRPVYVWIYGGGFIGGTGASPEFDGEALAKKGIVVVTFNYRVGALGFLATPALSRESGHGASGNYGLLDQVAMLRWVQANIAAFGGDPAKVTIGGQSAGAGSVGFMSTSPLSKGLFRAGIAESHARDPGDTELRYLSVSYRQLAKAERDGDAYAAAHGAHSLADLRAMPWQQVIEGSNTVDMAVETGSDGKPPLFRPVVDGWVLPHGYAQTYALQAQNKVAFFTGNNKDETGAVPETAFALLRAHPPQPRAGMPQTNVTLANYVAAAHRKFGAMADQFLRLYPAQDDAMAAVQNDAAARDCSRVSTFLWGQRWAPGTQKPVYTSFWTHAPPGPGHDMRGAFHGSEIYYAFNSLDAVDRPWTDEDRRIGETMSSYWANIIAKGDPNGGALPEWPRYEPTIPRVMELGDHFGPMAVAAPEKVAFWKRFFAGQPQW